MCKYQYINLKSQQLTVSVLFRRKPTGNTGGDIIKPKSEEIQE
jgi:hypothetical protein